jgi:5-methylcytosine-specific restriction endonuclease McrA
LKKKKPTFKALKKKLDVVFSQWIRLKDSTSDGQAVCVSCHAVKSWKEMQAGHFVSRTHLATRWDERNVAVQCMPCNVWKRGNYSAYTLYMLRKHGQKVIEELEALRHAPHKITAADLEEKLQHYNSKVAHIAMARRTVE